MEGASDSAVSLSPGKDKKGSVMVLGGGISGIQSSLDLADAGFKVYLVDKGLSIGGTMPQLDKTSERSGSEAKRSRMVPAMLWTPSATHVAGEQTAIS